MDLWIPDPMPARGLGAEGAMKAFLEQWTQDLLAVPGDAILPDFAAQCEAILAIRPRVISSIMGLCPDHFVRRMKAAGIQWFATVTTVAEAKTAETAGADAVIAQGMGAGGHRGAFISDEAMSSLVRLFSLLPAVADALSIPVIAAGGISDGRRIAAALTLGASAVQIGTGLLRCSEAQLPTAWADAIGSADPEDTIVTRAFSCRPGRAINNATESNPLRCFIIRGPAPAVSGARARGRQMVFVADRTAAVLSFLGERHEALWNPTDPRHSRAMAIE